MPNQPLFLYIKTQLGDIPIIIELINPFMGPVSILGMMNMVQVLQTKYYNQMTIIKMISLKSEFANRI